jgi:hypothetical protein
MGLWSRDGYGSSMEIFAVTNWAAADCFAVGTTIYVSRHALRECQH